MRVWANIGGNFWLTGFTLASVGQYSREFLADVQALILCCAPCDLRSDLAARVDKYRRCDEYQITVMQSGGGSFTYGVVCTPVLAELISVASVGQSLIIEGILGGMDLTSERGPIIEAISG